jgi:hypothetical protein
MFEAFPRLGAALCPPGWGESLLRRHFQEGIGAVLAAMARRGGPVALAELCALAWETVAAGYVLDDATDQQLATWRAFNDRDVRRALDLLQQLGAVHLDDERSAELTELAVWGDAPQPGRASAGRSHLPGADHLGRGGAPAGVAAAGGPRGHPAGPVASG